MASHFFLRVEGPAGEALVSFNWGPFEPKGKSREDQTMALLAKFKAKLGKSYINVGAELLNDTPRVKSYRFCEM